LSWLGEPCSTPGKRFPVQYADYDAFARIQKVMETLAGMARISSHCLGHLSRRQTRPFICLPDTAQPARTGNPAHSNHRFYGYLYLLDGELCSRRQTDTGDIPQKQLAAPVKYYLPSLASSLAMARSVTSRPAFKTASL